MQTAGKAFYDRQVAFFEATTEVAGGIERVCDAFAIQNDNATHIILVYMISHPKHN